MITSIIEYEGNTLVMEFPCKRYLMADHLGSIGIRKPAHEIKCMDEEEAEFKDWLQGQCSDGYGEEDFLKTVKEENYYGVPMIINVFRDENGQTIPLDFVKEIYAVADKGNRKVSYANKSNLEDTIVMLYSTQSVGEKMTEEERATHRPGPDRRNRTDTAFSPRKPGRKAKTETDDDDDAEKGDSMPMSQSNIPAGEETEIIINEKGDIVDERIRNDLPR